MYPENIDISAHAFRVTPNVLLLQPTIARLAAFIVPAPMKEIERTEEVSGMT